MARTSSPAIAAPTKYASVFSPQTSSPTAVFAPPPESKPPVIQPTTGGMEKNPFVPMTGGGGYVSQQQTGGLDPNPFGASVGNGTVRGNPHPPMFAPQTGGGGMVSSNLVQNDQPRYIQPPTAQHGGYQKAYTGDAGGSYTMPGTGGMEPYGGYNSPAIERFGPVSGGYQNSGLQTGGGGYVSQQANRLPRLAPTGGLLSSAGTSNGGRYDAATNISYDASGNQINQRRGQGISESDPRWNDMNAYFSGIGAGDDGANGRSLNSMVDNYLLSHGISPQMQQYRDLVARKMGFTSNPNGGEGVWNAGVENGGMEPNPYLNQQMQDMQARAYNADNGDLGEQVGNGTVRGYQGDQYAPMMSGDQPLTRENNPRTAAPIVPSNQLTRDNNLRTSAPVINQGQPTRENNPRTGNTINVPGGQRILGNNLSGGSGGGFPMGNSGVSGYNPATSDAYTYTAGGYDASGYDADTAAAAQAAAALWNVDGNQLVDTHVNRILADNSPLMERARSLAMQQANSRGLLNSSIAAGEGTNAMINSVMPMAQQNAGTYADSAKTNANNQTNVNVENARMSTDVNKFNSGSKNQARQFNSASLNDASRFNAESRNQANQWNAGMLTNNSQFNTSQRNRAGEFNSSEQNNMTRSREQNANARWLGNLDATTRTQLSQMGIDSQERMSELERQNRVTLAKIGSNTSLTNNLFNYNNNSANRVQQIIQNPNLTEEAKQQAIDWEFGLGQDTLDIVSAISEPDIVSLLV